MTPLERLLAGISRKQQKGYATTRSLERQEVINTITQTIIQSGAAANWPLAVNVETTLPANTQIVLNQFTVENDGVLNVDGYMSLMDDITIRGHLHIGANGTVRARN